LAIAGLALVVMIINVFIAVRQRKDELRRQSDIQSFDDRLKKAEEEFKKQQHIIKKDNISLEEKRKLIEASKKASARLKDQINTPIKQEETNNKEK